MIDGLLMNANAISIILIIQHSNINRSNTKNTTAELMVACSNQCGEFDMIMKNGPFDEQSKTFRYKKESLSLMQELR